MKKEKESFLVYKDWYNLISAFGNEDKGKLFTAIFEFQCHGVLFESENPALQGVFYYFKSRFECDQEKYKNKCEQNRENVNQRYNKGE